MIAERRMTKGASSASDITAVGRRIFFVETRCNRLCELMEDGTVTEIDSSLLQPRGLCAIEQGKALAICDTGHRRVKMIWLERRGKSQFSCVTLAGSGIKGLRDGAAASSRFVEPSAVCQLPNGTIVVLDETRLRCLSFDADVNSIVVRTIRISLNGSKVQDRLVCRPSCISTDSLGRIIVTGKHCVYMLSQRANMEDNVWNAKIIAGGRDPGFVDGMSQRFARFRNPQGVIASRKQPGVMYVADTGNNAVRLLRLPMSKSIKSDISTFPDCARITTLRFESLIRAPIRICLVSDSALLIVCKDGKIYTTTTTTTTDVSSSKDIHDGESVASTGIHSNINGENFVEHLRLKTTFRKLRQRSCESAEEWKGLFCRWLESRGLTAVEADLAAACVETDGEQRPKFEDVLQCLFEMGMAERALARDPKTLKKREGALDDGSEEDS